MTSSLAWLAMTAALVLAIASAVQYPLQTTFPIGGDAVRYIARANTVADHLPLDPLGAVQTLSKNSYYPGTIALVAATRLIPSQWPTRFIWLMVLAHIATGLSLAWLLYKIGGWPAAAVGLAIWGLATTTVDRHFEDGTLAQLMSLPLLLACFTAFLTRHLLLVVILGLLTLFLHPLSGLIALLTLTLTLLILYFSRRHFNTSDQHFISRLGLLLLLALILSVSSFGGLLLSGLPGDTDHISLSRLLGSHLGPFLILAPVGALLLIRRHRRLPFASQLLLTFATLAVLLTYNDLLGVALLTFRFQTYFILSIAIGAGLAVPHLIKQVPASSLTRGLLIILIFTATAIQAWQANAYVYNFYESPSRYARLSDHEQAAIAWLDQHAQGSLVASRSITRNSEWIPILAQVRWEGLDEHDPLFTTTTLDLSRLIANQGYEYAVFFTNREKVSQNFRDNLGDYPVVFTNDGTVIIDLMP